MRAGYRKSRAPDDLIDMLMIMGFVAGGVRDVKYVGTLEPAGGNIVKLGSLRVSGENGRCRRAYWMICSRPSRHDRR